ncbi:MAG: tRNA pseudouridine(55) synthase TruB [bacterium]|nr:tRNA pseudouridine(55) synthase TruB [bacterium]
MLGFLCVNKPRGISSAKVVSRVKYLTKEKVGHLGTLDPLAEGLLVIAIGKATRLFDYFLNKDKIYLASCKFGEETDTLDLGGKVVKNCKIKPTKEKICEIIAKMVGKCKQIPPIYSAKNIDGKRAYSLARSGEEVKLEPKEIEIYSLDLINYDGENLTLRIHCSSGTYVRAIFRDIAYSLNSCSTTTMIKREKAGLFSICDAVDFDKLDENLIKNNLISVQEIFNDEEKIVLNKTQILNLLQGKTVKISNDNIKNALFITDDNVAYGLGNVTNGVIKITAFLYEEEK